VTQDPEEDLELLAAKILFRDVDVERKAAVLLVGRRPEFEPATAFDGPSQDTLFDPFSLGDQRVQFFHTGVTFELRSNPVEFGDGDGRFDTERLDERVVCPLKFRAVFRNFVLRNRVRNVLEQLRKSVPLLLEVSERSLTFRDPLLP
jgi:hypothetical protein